MTNSGAFMMISLVAGSITIIASAIGLIIDHNRAKRLERERHRRNLTKDTVRTIMNYQTQERNDAARYRRRA
ncbi:MAG: hypothetical protein Q4B67_04500 [Eubacteriales bacterium]|nr:hypothetical protein [Eubacteriales bacterium]